MTGHDVEMRVLKFWPFPAASPAILMKKVDHFPSFPSYFPLGGKSLGVGRDRLGASARFLENIIAIGMGAWREEKLVTDEMRNSYRGKKRRSLAERLTRYWLVSTGEQ